jgi:hypothetical protein
LVWWQVNIASDPAFFYTDHLHMFKFHDSESCSMHQHYICSSAIYVYDPSLLKLHAPDDINKAFAADRYESIETHNPQYTRDGLFVPTNKQVLINRKSLAALPFT